MIAQLEENRERGAQPGGCRLHAATADNTLMPSTLHRRGRRGEQGGSGGKMGKVRSFALLNANNFISLCATRPPFSHKQRKEFPITPQVRR